MVLVYIKNFIFVINIFIKFYNLKNESDSTKNNK